MARDFIVEITEADVGKWVQKSIPTSTTIAKEFECSSILGSIQVSANSDGSNSKNISMYSKIPENVSLYFKAEKPSSAIFTDFFFRKKVSTGGGGGGGGGTTSVDCVKLTGNQTIAGDKTFSNPVILNERLRYSAANMSLAPSTNRSGDLYLSDGSIGSNCYSNLNLENKSKIKNVPNPTDDTDVANKRYVDGKTGVLSQLSTTAKGNLVESINEVKNSLALYKKAVIIQAGGQLPTTTQADTIYYTEV